MFSSLRTHIARRTSEGTLRRLNLLWVRRLALVLAALGFVAGIAVSLHAQPEMLRNLHWFPVLILAAITIPLTVLLNAYEFQLSADLISARMPFGTAMKTTIVGSAANLLPIPGSTLVRVAALKAAGASLKHGASTTLYVAVIWIAVSFVFAGVWILVLGDNMVGRAFVMIGAVSLITAFSATLRLLAQWRVPLQIFLVKFGLVSIDAVRIYLCLSALGIDATVAQAAAMTVSAALGSAVSIVPAGLGVREAVAAAMGPIVGLAASSAYLAVSLNRIAGLAVIAPAAMLLGLQRQKNQSEERLSS